MSDIGAIPSNPESESLVEHILNAPDTISDPAYQYVESSSSIDELQDKLSIIENANKGQDAELVSSINRIQTMIQDNASLDAIKNSF